MIHQNREELTVSFCVLVPAVHLLISCMTWFKLDSSSKTKCSIRIEHPWGNAPLLLTVLLQALKEYREELYKVWRFLLIKCQKGSPQLCLPLSALIFSIRTLCSHEQILIIDTEKLYAVFSYHLNCFHQVYCSQNEVCFPSSCQTVYFTLFPPPRTSFNVIK